MKEVSDRLKKIRIFPMTVTALWNIYVCLTTFFVAPYEHIYLKNLPDILIWVAILLYTCAGLGITWRFLSNQDNKGAYRGMIIWNFVLPFFAGIFVMCTIDSLYSFAGFMPGLEALGVAIVAFFTAAISAISGLAIGITMMIGRKRRAAGKKPGEWRESVGNFLNVATLLGIVLFIICGIGEVVSPAIRQAMRNNEKRKTEAFVQQVQEKHTVEALDELCFRSLQLLLGAQLVVDDEYPEDMFYDIFDQEALHESIEEYEELLETYKINRKVDDINSFIYYDYKNEMVVCIYELDALQIKHESYTTVWCLVAYNKDLDYYGIYFRENLPPEVQRYRQNMY